MFSSHPGYPIYKLRPVRRKFIAIALLALANCATAGAAPDTAPPDARTRDATAVTGFCAQIERLATRACRARYDCTASAPAIATLRAGQCACLAQGAIPPERDAALATLLADTPAYPCCAGIPVARDPGRCAAR